MAARRRDWLRLRSGGLAAVASARLRRRQRVDDAVPVEPVERRRADARRVVRPGLLGYTNGSWAGHGVSVAVRRRTCSTLSGFRVTPPRAQSRLPFSATMSAATPTACGDAIDVPWIH